MDTSNTSLIIPTYNSRDLLIESIASIRRQVDEDVEVIVVDNGSKDGTDAYCRKEQLTLITLPWSSSLAAAGNAGLRLASGDNILLMMPGVLVSRRWLKEMLHSLYKWRDAGVVRPAHIEAIKQTPVIASVPREKQVHQACMLFRRELLGHVGYLQKSPVYEDNVFDDYADRADQVGYRNMTTGKVTLNHARHTEPLPHIRSE
ncbi:hypothetical protein PAESOLCIP111_02565 [Paenibacillus solanacearum]|uniref:Glycosyltransferase 2-like domain-containing protein n=1 Tax=Paenibacillus solanacearum TaxID=2048548 RepID=A0A916NX94_9BACL|nr:glycosyltransferase [Paenibacillus solanacearum]CAG7623810.1 hypothetical protein PAESOLCIP111_02565 [Paenibacillus solanacearum]